MNKSHPDNLPISLKHVKKDMIWKRKLDIESVQKLIFCKNEFQLKRTTEFIIFEELIQESSQFNLECSHKMSRDHIDSCRFYLWYNGASYQKTKSLKKILLFSKKISSLDKVTINHSLINKILKTQPDLDKITKICLGIDFRSITAESRIKIGFYTENYSKMRQAVSEMLNHNKNFEELLFGNKFLFGIDLYFDGRTRLKVYPTFDHAMLKKPNVRNKIQDVFDNTTIELIKDCSEFFVSFNDKWKKTLHFFPKDKNRERFIKKLSNSCVEALDQRNLKGGYPTWAFSFPEQEFLKRKTKNINLYY